MAARKNLFEQISPKITNNERAKATKMKRAGITASDERRCAQLHRKRRPNGARNGISTGVLFKISAQYYSNFHQHMYILSNSVINVVPSQQATREQI